jgi:hypothetical protein
MSFALTMYYQYLEQKEHNVNLKKNYAMLSDIWKSLYSNLPHNAIAYTTTENGIKNCYDYQNHYRIRSKKSFQETISKHILYCWP